MLRITRFSHCQIQFKLPGTLHNKARLWLLRASVDFRPIVQELRTTLDEPIAYDNPNLSCKKVLDKWLKKH